MRVPAKQGTLWKSAERKQNKGNQSQQCTIQQLTNRCLWQRWKNQFLY